MKTKLWTIQTSEKWDEFLRTGVLQAPETYTPDDFVDRSVIQAYDWMVVQMKTRIGPPPAGIKYPVWAWYQYLGAKRRMPDLRYRAHLPSGTKGVRIEFVMDASAVLLSDFELWHQPYCYRGYIGADWETFEAELERRYANKKSEAYRSEIRQKIEKSWEKIFDLSWHCEDWTLPLEKRSIQATFWNLNLDDVLGWKVFTAR